MIKLSKELGLSIQVRFVGWVDDPTKYMTDGSIYVCSSHYEGFGLSVAEAMAMGLPVVSTDISGVRCFIKDNETGFLVEPGNPQLLSRRILQVITDADLCRKVSNQGQNYIFTHFDIAKTVRKYETCYIGDSYAV